MAKLASENNFVVYGQTATATADASSIGRSKSVGVGQSHRARGPVWKKYPRNKFQVSSRRVEQILKWKNKAVLVID